MLHSAAFDQDEDEQQDDDLRPYNVIIVYGGCLLWSSDKMKLAMGIPASFLRTHARQKRLETKKMRRQGKK